MNKFRYISITLLLAALTFLTGCAKEGCTDNDATNYSTDAKKDNGTCRFEGRMVFWMNQATSTFLLNDGAVSLTYYLDGEVVGSAAASTYFNGSPDCGTNGAVTITKDLLESKSLTGNLKIKDQTGHTYYDLAVTFGANECLSVELN